MCVGTWIPLSDSCCCCMVRLVRSIFATSLAWRTSFHNHVQRFYGTVSQVMWVPLW
jgi:hypothetical protein